MPRLYAQLRASSTDDIFKLSRFPGWIVVTDAVREAITGAGLTGVRFFEIGAITD